MSLGNITNTFFHTPHGYFYNWLIDATGSWVAQMFGDTTHANIVKQSLISIVAGDMSMFALGIGVLIVSIMAIYRIIAANAEGDWGKGGSNAWYMLIAALAFMLVVPIPKNSPYGKYSGGYYSASQIVVVCALLIGSNAADYLWNASSKYLMTVPRIRYNKQSVLTSASNTLRSLVCSYGVKSSSGSTPFMTVVDKSGESTNYGSLNTNAFSNASKIEWAGGLCGTVVLGDKKDTSDANKYAKLRAKYINEFFTRAEPQIIQAYAGIVNNLNGIAQKIHQTSGIALAMLSPNSTQADDKNLTILNSLISSFKTSVKNYQNTLAQIPNNIDVGDIKNDLETKMKETGWASAGIYYLELANYQAAYNRLVSNFTESASFSTPPLCGSLFNEGGCIEKQYVPDFIQGVNSVVANSIPSLATNAELGTTALSANLHNLCNSKGCNATDVNRSLAVFLSQGFIKSSQWVGRFSTVNQENPGGVSDFNSNINPVWALSSMGHAFLTYAGTIWAFKTIMQIANKTVNNEDKAVNSSVLGFFGGGVVAAPVAATLSTMLASVISACTYTAIYLTSIGFLLGYVLVYWPVIIWMFMIIGYLVLVLEAIVAIPLGIIKLTVYEGSGVSGTNFQRLSALMFAVISRPILYILAFDISIITMYIGFGIMNTMFWQVASMNTTFGIIETLATITVYAGLSFVFIKIVFGYMHRLPEAVMYWLTGQMYSMFTDGGDPATQAVEGVGRSGGAGISNFIGSPNSDK